MLPNDVATVAEMLRLNGYSTAAYGKHHETAVWEISPSGPFARWPNYIGYDEFYGFMGGETNQWAPAVYHNLNRVETPDDPDYHFMNDMTNQAIEDMGEMNNTLVIYIAGDNGTSAEGVMNGLYNEYTYFNKEPKGSDVDFMLKYYDEWGGASTYPHMAAGWAVCFDSPFTWTKQVASNYGGTRNSMVMRWPNRIKTKGEMRSQWHHVIDIVPTILEAAGLPEPRIVNGTPQRPIEGTSMVYSWDYPKVPSRHQIQYFEMFGNRGIYYDGWFAGTVHLKPWCKVENKFPEDTWELYHVA